MNIAAIMHRPTLENIYPIDRTKLCFKIQTARDDMKNINLVWWFRCDENQNKLRRVPLILEYRDKYSDYYETVVDTKEIAAYVRYYFVFDDDNEKISYGAKGFDNGEPDFNKNYFEFLWPNKSDGHYAPSWSNKLIYYQIFPERFKNGDETLSPKDCVPWGSKPTRENFMGGDIRGIIDELDYIKDLGVNCIYMTPIFKAPSNHKYDTVDYYEINPSFGNKDDLRKLVDEVHRKDMKIILDGVFNHCGYYWPYFQDVVKKGKGSKFADWFYIDNYPILLEEKNYDCVGHYKWMPKLNMENSDVVEYFIKIGEYWIKEFNIDGWRLDVADEIATTFFQRFSTRIKKIKPDALLLGETWGDAGKLVNSDRLDTAMNYLFRDAMVDWIAKEEIKPSRFDHLINKMLSLYPREVSLRMYNLLDSHDTARFMYECNNDIRKYKLAIAMQMTMPGCPAIFYGDEIGLSGDNDPDCRLCMEWNEIKQNKELLSWYKKLISIRKNNRTLYEGKYHSLICDDERNIYAYTRDIDEESIVVIINASECKHEVFLPIEKTIWCDVLNESYITENMINVPSFSVHILKKGGNLKR
ncbi:MAG: glycoside hydrolase family 13 protein [Erysipelotrichaceae bacterium]|nr:glycoside hydrolase family 13 protein [Erysipelotrichaceae bacterium]